MADLAGKFSNRLEDKPGDFRRKLLSSSLAPAGAERQALEGRRDELLRSLRPTPGTEANIAILKLLAGSPQFGMTEREAAEKTELYAEALREQPTWAIERARIAFSKGGWKSAWDGRGCPSSANVVAECRFLLLSIEEELFRLGQILDAELVDTDTTADERAAAVAHWQQIRSGIASHNVISERTGDEIAKERSEMARANERVAARTGGTATGVATDEMRRTLADILAKQASEAA